MRVMLVSSEISPYAKTGGLGEVSGVLPSALAEEGVEVKLFMPLYGSICHDEYKIEDTGLKVHVRMADRIFDGDIYVGDHGGGVKVYFIKESYYFDRMGLYGTAEGDFPDNDERFVFFSKAVLEACRLLEWQPQIIHCNDWQTGLIPLLLKSLYKEDPFYQPIKSIMAIHNMGYQGRFSRQAFHLTNLGWEFFSMEGIEYYGEINLLKGGLLYADSLVTVSPTYAREIQGAEYGHGLEGVLSKRSYQLYGILNGIDWDQWNPEKDLYLSAHFSAKDLTGKWKNKKALLEKFGLKARRKVPLIAMVTRLAGQKGINLVLEALDSMMELDFQFILLGDGDGRLAEMFLRMAEKYEGKIGVNIGFDTALSHEVEAGADMLLVPSLYEPCGLTQLYALRYGTVPVVRKTGGLNDTVVSYEEDKKRETGFKFTAYHSGALLEVLKRARERFDDQKEWKALVRRGMGRDFSWKQSAIEYVKLYENTLSRSS